MIKGLKTASIKTKTISNYSVQMALVDHSTQTEGILEP